MIMTVEGNVLQCGLGSAVLELLEERGNDARVKCLCGAAENKGHRYLRWPF